MLKWLNDSPAYLYTILTLSKLLYPIVSRALYRNVTLTKLGAFWAFDRLLHSNPEYTFRILRLKLWIQGITDWPAYLPAHVVFDSISRIPKLRELIIGNLACEAIDFSRVKSSTDFLNKSVRSLVLIDVRRQLHVGTTHLIAARFPNIEELTVAGFRNNNPLSAHQFFPNFPSLQYLQDLKLYDVANLNEFHHAIKASLPRPLRCLLLRGLVLHAGDIMEGLGQDLTEGIKIDIIPSYVIQQNFDATTVLSPNLVWIDLTVPTFISPSSLIEYCQNSKLSPALRHVLLTWWSVDINYTDWNRETLKMLKRVCKSRGIKFRYCRGKKNPGFIPQPTGHELLPWLIGQPNQIPPHITAQLASQVFTPAFNAVNPPNFPPQNLPLPQNPWGLDNLAYIWPGGNAPMIPQVTEQMAGQLGGIWAVNQPNLVFGPIPPIFLHNTNTQAIEHPQFAPNLAHLQQPETIIEPAFNPNVNEMVTDVTLSVQGEA